MKNKKAKWFTENSNWLFWVVLAPAVILVNLGVTRIKVLATYGFVSGYFWTLLIIIVLFLLSMLLLLFIIYLNDDLDGNNKRRFLWFDKLINKWHLKE
ncbi:MAG: hypothetical protein KAH01_01870 [Caldisericia bacterium]|nr:hypothetical protein [Caldisericia bacterium]